MFDRESSSRQILPGEFHEIQPLSSAGSKHGLAECAGSPFEKVIAVVDAGYYILAKPEKTRATQIDDVSILDPWDYAIRKGTCKHVAGSLPSHPSWKSCSKYVLFTIGSRSL